MRPLAELEDGVLRGMRGLCFDVDDTVTKDGALETAALGAMHALRDAGLEAIAVTGRPVGWAEVFAATWPVSLAVGENGAGWARLARDGGRRVLLRGAFDGSPELRDRRDRLVATVRARMPDVKLAGDSSLRRFDVAFDVAENEQLAPERVELLRLACEELGAHVVVSSVHLHAAFGAWDKAVGVVHAAGTALGLGEADVRDSFVFVGDSGNDAAAFSFFSCTVGVANVREHLARLPMAPGYVSSASRGAGFAELAMRLVRAKEGRG
jgi:HAD superfamily hydrolase (TIGR01484 family)